jgi:hypothetical protein
MSSPRSAEPENPSRKEFAAIVKAYLVENGICKDAILNLEQFTLVCQSDNEWDAQTFVLVNAYEDYCQVEIADRPKVLAHYFAQDDAIPTELERAIDNVLPHIQARGSFDIIKLTPRSENDNVMSDGQAQIPLTVIGEHFQLSLVYDTPKSMSHLNQKVLDSWGIGFEELMERAQKNLAAITPEPLRQITPGIYCSPYSDNHDATRLMLIDRVKQCQVKGRHLAFTPNRDSLLITGDEDEASIAVVAATVQDLLNSPRPLPAFPLVLQDEVWQIWDVPKFHPSAQIIANLSNYGFNDIYGLQKAVLDLEHERDNVEIFIGSFKALTREGTDEIISICSWGEGVPTLLPVTELIDFVVAKGESFDLLFAAPFEIALAIVGARMQPVDIYPPRYFVNTFPTKDELDKIRALAEKAGTLIV